jgi:hypothetical protein
VAQHTLLRRCRRDARGECEGEYQCLCEATPAHVRLLSPDAGERERLLRAIPSLKNARAGDCIKRSNVAAIVSAAIS